jgi:hypothetical protein
LRITAAASANGRTNLLRKRVSREAPVATKQKPGRRFKIVRLAGVQDRNANAG